MLFERKKLYVREKSCLRCFAYIHTDSRKCKFCGYVFKSSGRYLVDKFLHAFRLKRVYSSPSISDNETPSIDNNHEFFTPTEIEQLSSFEDSQILMFMNLDDITLLDETALIQLGETIIDLNELSICS